MFESQTYNAILQRMLDRVSKKFDKREGSVIWDTHSPTAIELKNLYIELDEMIKNSYGDTASREFLILRCHERGITPTPETKAILKGEFTPASIDVTGQRFNGNDLNYTVLEQIEDGVYKVECETAGAVGNRYLGMLVPIEYIEGLETAELTEVLIPGEDEEETEVLRKRYFDSFEGKEFSGNEADYIKKCNAIPGVGCTKVTRVWNKDIRPAEMIPSETVVAWYRGIIGTLDEEVSLWLSTVYMAAVEKLLTVGGTVLLTILDSEYNPASDLLLSVVQNAFDPPIDAGEGKGLAPIGHVVSVKSASAVAVSVQTNIVFDVGYGWDNLQVPIEEAISNYFLELRQKWQDAPYIVVRVSQIETRILAVQGIIDVSDSTLNGEAKNLTLGKYEVPVFGGASG